MTSARNTEAQPGQGDAFRVVIYSHDTYGLGHLTRTQRIAAGIVDAFPDACVLIVSGSPIAHRFHFPDRVDYLKLPSVVKLGPGEYGSRTLAITPRRIRRLRSRLILTAIDLFRPNLLMVDNVPLGMKGELRPALRHLRRRYPGSRIHLNLRDILDDAQTIRTSWQQTGTAREIEEFFDAINIFGSREIYDSQEAYGLPADRTRFLGYIRADDLPRSVHPVAGTSAGRHRVLVTVGGGGDGQALLDCVAELQAGLGPDSPFHFLVVTGPLMETLLRLDLVERLRRLPAVEVHEYLEDLPSRMAQADLVLTMGGYNTLCEVMTHARRAVVVPRQYPRREQLIRAEALAARGIVRALPMDCLTAGSLYESLTESLAAGPLIADADLPSLDGIAALQARLREDASLLWLPAGGQAAALVPMAATGAGAAPNSDGASRREQLESTGRGAHIRPLKGLLLAACLLPLAPGLLRADLRPAQAEVATRFGHDSNLLDASDAERDAFAAGSPDAFFVVDAMADRFLALAAEARWALGRPGGIKTQIGAGYERLQYLGNPIASREEFSAELSGRLGARTRLSLELAHKPQVYGRHRADKDAQPGAPRFRAEVYSAWEAGLALRRTLGERWRLDSRVGGLRRDYSEAFPERDRRRLELESAVVWAMRPGLELAVRGGYQRSLSRNQPDLGKDLSYTEWELEPAATVEMAPLALALETGLQLSWRRYLSSLPDDWNHNGRHDRFGALHVELRRDLRPGLAFVTDFAHAWRRAELAADLAVDYDEEGSFSESVFSAGLDWRWEH